MCGEWWVLAILLRDFLLMSNVRYSCSRTGKSAWNQCVFNRSGCSALDTVIPRGGHYDQLYVFQRGLKVWPLLFEIFSVLRTQIQHAFDHDSMA